MTTRKKNKSLRGLSTSEPNAFAFAEHFHGEQKYGNLPYMVHLAMTFEVYLEHTAPDDLNAVIMKALWLHDVLEDTHCKPQFILDYFHDRRLLILIQAVTDKPGENRKARHRNTYPELAGDNWAVVVKLCDRIANVRHSIAEKSGFLKMYKREYPFFRKSLCGCTREPNASLWKTLDELMEWKQQN